jgi:hypothetical protein
MRAAMPMLLHRRRLPGERTYREGNQSTARGTKDARSFVIVRNPQSHCGTWQVGRVLRMRASGLNTSPTMQLTVGRPPGSGLAGLYTLVLEKHRYPIMVRLFDQQCRIGFGEVLAVMRRKPIGPARVEAMGKVPAPHPPRKARA